MSLRFIYGRAGSGKSTFCYNEIKTKVSFENKVYVVTPEQFSYSAEKNLLEFFNTNSITNIEVISFKRMANRVFEEVGGSLDTQISEAGKAMLIYDIFQKQQKELTFLKNSKENIETITKTIKEFKKHNLSAKQIKNAIEKIEDKNLKLKLEDMYTVYSDYEATICNKYLDEEDILTKLAIKLENSNMFNNSYVYIDEFSGFTKQEYEIIRQIIKKAEQVTINVCTDKLEENSIKETDIFYANKNVIKQIEKIAKEENITIDTPLLMENSIRFKNEELKHLEENIYSNTYKIYNNKTENIKLFLALNPYTEIENVAKTIVNLVREDNIKYNEIGIITKNIDQTSTLIKAIFSKYEIPLYIDKKDELYQNILIKYILSVLEVFAKNWSYESVFNYIKSGFSEIDKQDIYKLQNYCLKWGIRGSKWYKEDFEETDFNDIRKQVVKPLLDFKENLKGRKTAKEISTEIYDFLDKNNIYTKLSEKIEYLEEIREINIAKEYKKSLEILVNILDDIVLLFNNEKMSFEKYEELLKIGLRNKDLGTIPQAVDQVIVGDIDRSKTQNVKVVFLIGVNDGIFPSINKNEGFLDDKDREQLKNVDAEIAKGTLENLFDEQFNIYKAITIAEKSLYISYTSSDKDGKGLRPSMLINKIKKIFPKIEEESDIITNKEGIYTKGSTFNELLLNIKRYSDGENIDKIWFDIYNWYANDKEWKIKLEKAIQGLKYSNKAENLSCENIKELYGQTLKTSVSKLEQYKNCPFAFYLKYGLKIDEQEEFTINPIDTGSFMHEVIDNFFNETKDLDYKELEKSDIQEIVNRIIEEKLLLSKNKKFTATAKFQVLTNRLKKVITEAIYYLVYQLKNSNFKVLENEFSFNKKIDNTEIVGKIDRIDIAENEEGKFIRIIDYKSSTKSLDLNKVVSGIQIQLLTYMDILSTQENREAAGMLYYNLIDPIISKNKNLTDSEIEEELKKKFKMTGLVLSNVKVIRMMDKKLEGGSSNTIPVYIDKDGNISKTRSNVVTKEDFSNLQKRCREIIKQLSNEILNGNINIKPSFDVKQKKSACKYCKYSTICNFNPKVNTYEYIQNKTKEEILKEIKEN